MPPLLKRAARYQKNRSALPLNERVSKKVATFSPSMQKAVTDLLSSPSTPQRTHALVQLSHHPKGRMALRFIENALMDEAEVVRVNALHALERLKAKSSIPKIELLLADPHESVQLAAIHVLTNLDSRKSAPKIEHLLRSPNIHVRKQAFEYWADLNGTPTELYQQHVLDPQFTDRNRMVIRRQQERTGPPTTLLGGKMFRKAMFRTVPPTALQAWIKALELGISAEPILKKNGKYRIALRPDGQYRVSTAVLHGASVKAFLESQKNYDRYGEEVTQQMGEIMEQLKRHHIDHHHTTPKNFVVVMENKKPKVYVVDFDRARIEN